MKGSPKFFGKALVGTKGQIVIPAEARKALGIKSGDSVVIISGPPHHEKVISLIPEKEFNKFLGLLEGHLTTMKKEIKKKNKS
ncbi:MAG: AbrB/MazE/SpoVT family DNA-binding domain-containing protein [Candidatus Omnitrophota bacterium]